MLITLTLTLVGLSLIYLEFFLPGAIMGIGGGILIGTSFVFFLLLQPGILPIFLYLLGVIIALFAIIKIALWHVKITSKK